MVMTGLGEPLDRRTLREQCLALLRSAITDGRLPAGTRLVETELSAAYGVSRGTLREALRALQQEGLVTTGARGLAVRQFSPQEIREIFTVRASLEALAVELLAAREDRAHLVRQLRDALERIRDEEGNLGAQAEADLAFHHLLCTLSGNATLLQTWKFLSGHVRLTIMSAGPEKALHNMSADRHSPFLDAIEHGDGTEGRRVVHEHMRQAADRVVGALTHRDGAD